MTEATSLARECNAVEPGQNEGEFSELIQLVADLKPKNVMEIGTEGGCTFLAWCRLAAPEGLKISVDWQNTGVGRGRWLTPELRDPRDERLKSWAPNVVLIEGDSHTAETKQQVVDALGCELLDFLFIDGDHSVGGVQKDFDDYGPLVRPGGLVAFHDIKHCAYHRQAGCYVDVFWNRLKVNHPRWQELRSNEHVWGGIGVLEV